MTPRPGTVRSTAVAEPDDGADPSLTHVIRGGSRGFTVLLLGGIVQPWAAEAFPPLGFVWLALVAVAAFAWAGWPRGAVQLKARFDRAAIGCAAALCSYLLVLPLVLSAAGSVPWSQLAFTCMTAVAVGALVGAGAPGPERSGNRRA